MTQQEMEKLAQMEYFDLGDLEQIAIPHIVSFAIKMYNQAIQDAADNARLKPYGRYANVFDDNLMDIDKSSILNLKIN